MTIDVPTVHVHRKYQLLRRNNSIPIELHTFLYFSLL